ncbi:MAG: glycosyltransferase family 8 protein [Pseudonocardiaceae bacterium]
MTDDRYAGFAAVAAASMLENSPRPDLVEVHVLHPDLAATTTARLRQVIEDRGGTVRLHDVAAMVDASDGYRSRTPHFYRLLAPQVLPIDVDRFVYLDCDLIVRGDVHHLAGVGLDGAIAAACQDYLGTMREAVANHDELGLPADAPYFNSGVMVVDRQKWAATGVSERVLECTRANEPHLYAQDRFFQYDQYALNVVLHGAITSLDRAWNYGSEYPFREVDIVHFNGHGKPWSPTCTAQFRDEFYAVLRRAGWRPDELPGGSGS